MSATPRWVTRACALACALSTLLLPATGAVAAPVATSLTGASPVPFPTSTATPAATDSDTTLYVDPDGSDSGSGSERAPLRTIQRALDEAGPGTTIRLAPGVYRERVRTVRAGTASAPIRIVGPETGKNPADRRQATLYGTSRIVSIDHSYIEVRGFTIDGQEKLAGRSWPTRSRDVRAFKESVRKQVADGRLIYVGVSDSSRDITGVRVDDMYLTGAGGECVRLRNNAHDNVIENSTIRFCGMYAKGTSGDPWHNGEGVYIGTSPKSTGQPMHKNDQSHRNIVRDNTIQTFGSECFNVKENAHDNVFEGNLCSANLEGIDHHGSNIELRGHDNVVRDNVVEDSANWNIKIQSDSTRYDKGGNTVTDNTLRGAATAALRVKSTARQGAICGNTVQAPTLSDGLSATQRSQAVAPCR